MKWTKNPLLGDSSLLNGHAVLTVPPILINFISLSFCLVSGNAFATHTQTATVSIIRLFLPHKHLIILKKQKKKKKKNPDKRRIEGFPAGSVVKNLPANAGDTGFDPWSIREDPTCHKATKPVHHSN